MDYSGISFYHDIAYMAIIIRGRTRKKIKSNYHIRLNFVYIQILSELIRFYNSDVHYALSSVIRNTYLISYKSLYIRSVQYQNQSHMIGNVY